MTPIELTASVPLARLDLGAVGQDCTSSVQEFRARSDEPFVPLPCKTHRAICRLAAGRRIVIAKVTFAAAVLHLHLDLT